MKKVKIMLTCIAILAIVGGALAFKANYQADICYVTPSVLPNNDLTCTDNAGRELTCFDQPTVGTFEPGKDVISTYCTTELVVTCQGEKCLETTTVFQD